MLFCRPVQQLYAGPHRHRVYGQAWLLAGGGSGLVVCSCWSRRVCGCALAEYVPLCLALQENPSRSAGERRGGLTLSSALATVVAPLFFFFPGRARQITSPTPSRRHTSARTTPLSRRKPSTSTVHIGREGGDRGEVGWWELSDALVGRPVHVYVGRSGR